ncbi:MAG: restriction endonuclease subunit M [Chloroflexi bacterium]|nr:restriction endonuclease subunit M [Chloroflexota bacterium]
MSDQVKSKQRVTDHGEVFTAEREVNAMLDLVKQETERIDSRFLEPACGNGNFLAEILRRKLAVVKRKYRKSPIDFEKYAVLAATSIYGVDILQDNVDACRKRMFEIWDKEYQTVLKKEVNEDCREAVRFIFGRNIVCGNALSLKKVDTHGKDINEPIVFSEWAFVTGFNLQRSDYTFDRLLEGDVAGRDLYGKEKQAKTQELTQQSLFADSQAEKLPPEGDKLEDEGKFVGKTITHYRRVQDNG